VLCVVERGAGGFLRVVETTGLEPVASCV